MNPKRFWLGSLALGLSSSIGFISFSSAVQAAGFDDPLSNSTYSGTAENSNSYSEPSQYEVAPHYTINSQVRDRQTTAPILTWRNWSSPYAEGESICRENNSDVVCLSPEMANHMRW